eukprot:1270671-Prymnesium_polylepis.2
MSGSSRTKQSKCSCHHTSSVPSGPAHSTSDRPCRSLPRPMRVCRLRLVCAPSMVKTQYLHTHDAHVRTSSRQRVPGLGLRERLGHGEVGARVSVQRVTTRARGRTGRSFRRGRGWAAARRARL